MYDSIRNYSVEYKRRMRFEELDDWCSLEYNVERNLYKFLVQMFCTKLETQIRNFGVLRTRDIDLSVIV